MPDALSQPACWTADSARTILRNEALEGNDAIFLATHSPVRGFRMSGSHASDLSEATEGGLLAALSDAGRRHAFSVVQGEPGSGKSHLIRWLKVNWPQNDQDIVLLLQRADGSLHRALSQLREALPSEFHNLFDGMGQQQKASLSGRAKEFLMSLAVRMDPDFYESNPFPDKDWCASHDLQSLLLSSVIRENWAGPRRVLEVMDGRGGERNSESASFGVEDVVELANWARSMTEGGRAKRIADRLYDEAHLLKLTLDDAEAEGTPLKTALDACAAELKQSRAFADALNRRRNEAVQNVIGVSAARLKELFEKVRSELAQRDQRLVLLLEDITSFEGLDDSLIDALVLNADTRSDKLCPLISVVGVTPQYYDKLPPNYRQRVTHYVQLGDPGAFGGALQDVAALRDPSDRAAFVSRYLAATRAGMAELEKWRNELKFRRDLPPPNVCDRCSRREPCHAVFGAVDDVGLFPFTADAVNGFFYALKIDDNGQTHRTPRGVVQHVLAPTLLHPRALIDGNYPGGEIETTGLEIRNLPGYLQTMLAAAFPDDATRQGQMHRVLALWGEPDQQGVTTDKKGRRRFANVAEGVFTAFGLPWIAGAAAPIGDPEPEIPNAQPEPTEPTATPEPITTVGKPQRPRPNPPFIGPRRPTDPQLIRLRDQVPQARDGNRRIQDPSLWNNAAFQVLQSLSPRTIGLDRWTWSRLFTVDLIKIEGTGKIRSDHFVLPKESTLYAGLEAYAELKLEQASAEALDFHRRKLARFLRWLEKLARRHAEKRLNLQPGEEWNAAAPAAQLLMARGWLRGATSPTESLHRQWSDALSDEKESPGDLQERTKPWQDFVKDTHSWNARFRQMLREMVRLQQGQGRSFGLADAGLVAERLIAFADGRFQFSDVFSNTEETAIDEVDKVIELTRAYKTRLDDVASGELKLLQERAADLDARLHGTSIAVRANRIDNISSEIVKHLPSSSQTQTRWREDKAKRASLLQDNKALEDVQQWIIKLADQASIPENRLARLEWLTRAPARNLNLARELFVLAGDPLIHVLLLAVRSRVEEGQRGADVEQFKEFATALRSAAAKAKAVASGQPS